MPHVPTRSDEISIEARLTEGGVKAAVKSRVAAALDRLIGGYFDRIDQNAQAKADVQEALTRAEGIAALQKLANDPAFGDSLAKSVLPTYRQMAIEQDNRNKIAKEMVDETISMSQSEYVESKSSEEIIDDDWMNAFFRFSGEASSDDMRVLWARVLAGEAHAPGSFSRRTLLSISTLDLYTATQYQNISKRRVGSQGSFLRPHSFDNETYPSIQILSEFGLITGFDAPGTVVTFKTEGRYCFIRFSAAFLVLRMKDNRDVELPAIHATRAGREILSIIPRQEFNDAVEIAKEIVSIVAERIDCASMHKFVNAAQYNRNPDIVLAGVFQDPPEEKS